jgi:hypothetical protein
MSPKEKAKELISDFEKITRPLFKLNEYDIEKEYNKQCALKVVDEILSVRNDAGSFLVKGTTLKYWGEVKEQIKIYE